ncbi:hypothetical protein ACFE04_015103 [Oxalis oulophora]
MKPGYRFDVVKHGDVLRFNGTRYTYDGDLTKDIVAVNLKILHSNLNSIEFGECIRNNGEVYVFVAHGVGVGLDDIEDDDLGFDEIDQVINENNFEKYNTSSDLDDSYDEYDVLSNDSEDDELSVARENLRKVVEKKSDLRNLSKIVKEIDNIESKKKLKEKCGEDLTQRMDVDVDSGDSYDTEFDDVICRRRRIKLQKFDESNRILVFALDMYFATTERTHIV